MIHARFQNQEPSSSRGVSRACSGFTIIEIMVTVGILVLVAAGVASVFTSISDTVNTGKRVSEINRFSAQLERVMRRDFENMTRDGYLVIANQYTNDGARRYPAQPLGPIRPQQQRSAWSPAPDR